MSNSAACFIVFIFFFIVGMWMYTGVAAYQCHKKGGVLLTQFFGLPVCVNEIRR